MYLWFIMRRQRNIHGANDMNTFTPAEMVLNEITEKMLDLENTIAVYNRASQYGSVPNGQEAFIEHLHNEWDHLKCRRDKVKLLMQAN